MRVGRFAEHALHFKMRDQILDITLSGLSYGGDALGRVPTGDKEFADRVVFVPFGLPGERVRVRIVEERRSFARGQLLEVLEASPERIAARCKHFGICGGCHYQHMPYEAQLRAKTEILRDQLRRIGHIQDPPIKQAVPSPDPWNYRNQVQFHMRRDGKLGYVRAAAAHDRDERVFTVEECHLPEVAINSLWPQLEFDPETDIERVSIRHGAEDELMLVLESGSPEMPELEVEAGISIAHIFEEHTAVIAGADSITLRLLGRDFQVSAASFFQVNTAMASRMVEHVLTHLPTSQTTMVDVYCGVGLFSAFMASRCQRLIGIESSPSACEDFMINLNEFDNVELYEDAAENVLPTLHIRPDVILVDPPRSGLERVALDAIVQMKPGSIIYVSCDPSTLARDAASLLKAGYQLRSVTPFDLFPQTFHIESISQFEYEPLAGPTPATS